MQCGQTDTGVFKSWLDCTANRLAGHTGTHWTHGYIVEYMNGRRRSGGLDSIHCWNDIRVLSKGSVFMDHGSCVFADWDPQLMRTSLRLTSHRPTILDAYATRLDTLVLKVLLEYCRKYGIHSELLSLAIRKYALEKQTPPFKPLTLVRKILPFR